MLSHVMRHEARSLAADRTLQAVALLFGAILVYALANGVAWLRVQETTLASAAADDLTRREALAAQIRALEDGTATPAGGDPRAPATLGGARGARLAALPPGPLGALAAGQGDLLPFYYQVSLASNDQSFVQNGEIENPLNLMVGRFDLAFVLIFVLPLLILVVSYNLISAEREQGTLALTLAQPVPLATVVGGKVALRALVVLGAAVALTLAGALIVETDRPGALVLWTVSVTLYALFWFALAVAVNALGRGSAWNATVLVGAWLALVVVVPALVNVAAHLIHPLPSRVEMITAQRDASNDAVNRRSELLARYYEDHPEMVQGLALDTANAAARSWAATEEVNRRLSEVASRYEARLAEQHRLIGRWRFLSPALLAQDALLDAAGTGDARFGRFRGQVMEFAEAWKAFFVPHVLAGTHLSSADLEAVPEFRFVEEPPGALARRVAAPLLVLTGLTLVVAGVGLRLLSRYPVLG